MLLEGKSGVILGVANKRSIAYACAQAASRQGARLVLTYQNERLARQAESLAAGLPGEAVCVPCDVSDDDSLAAAARAVGERIGRVDFAIHSVAFAKREELEGRFLDTTREGWRVALDVSSYSFAALARQLEPLMTEGGSLVTMTYLGGERVMPNYNVMGPAKAALESTVRYLATDLGPKTIRVNALSAGPIRTLAAAGISGFSQMLEVSQARSPLKRNATTEEVAEASFLLLSVLSGAVTGRTLWVDCGYHIMAV